MASLQAVLIGALREELSDGDPAQFADAVEQLVNATGAVQAAAVEALVKRRSRELESQAHTDPLTGLGNLRALQRQIGRLLAVQKRYDHPFAVLLMDVDGLKRINDAHGHQAGDRVLVQVAMAMRRSIRSVDTAARLGGDEFCVLAPEQDAAKAMLLATRLGSAVRDEVAMPDAPAVSLSIGVAACPEHGDERRDADRHGGPRHVPREGVRPGSGAERRAEPGARRGGEDLEPGSTRVLCRSLVPHGYKKRRSGVGQSWEARPPEPGRIQIDTLLPQRCAPGTGPPVA